MRAPKNTGKMDVPDLLGVLADGMVMGSGAIEMQEAQGQRSFVGSDTLPTQFMGGRDHLEAAGVQFLGPVEGDPLFQYVKLPAGWKKEPTEHSMWSRLVDDKGRERGSIFYKAAFYDRGAHLGLSARFRVRRDYEREDAGVARVMDGDEVIHVVELPPTEGESGYATGDRAMAAAVEWLETARPNWQDPGAYWNEP